MTQLDIAVVGGGIIGCLIAREIAARAPELSILVLEQDAVGSGASRRSAGLHFPRGATERVRRMSAYSQEVYRALAAADPALPIHPVPMSVVSSDPGVAGVYLRLRRTDRLPGPLTGLPGPLAGLPDGAAVWEADGGQYADVGRLTELLARALRPGVSVREGVAVTAVAPGPAGYQLRLGTGESVTARAVVLAPGPWLAGWSTRLGTWGTELAALELRVKEIVALHVERPPEPGDGVVVFHDEDAFLLPLHDRGHWLFSYTCQDWDVDPDTLHPGLSADNLAEAREALRRWSPELAVHATGGRVFCDAYAPDRQPVVRPLDADRRLVFAGAANGSGYRLAPAIAAETADLLLPELASRTTQLTSDLGSHA